MTREGPSSRRSRPSASAVVAFTGRPPGCCPAGSGSPGCQVTTARTGNDRQAWTTHSQYFELSSRLTPPVIGHTFTTTDMLFNHFSIGVPSVPLMVADLEVPATGLRGFTVIDS